MSKDGYYERILRAIANRVNSEGQHTRTDVIADQIRLTIPSEPSQNGNELEEYYRQSLWAIYERINGMWDSPNLNLFMAELQTDTVADIGEIATTALGEDPQG